MKKILSVIAAVLICVLVFCGCEKSDTNGAQSGAQTSLRRRKVQNSSKKKCFSKN